MSNKIYVAFISVLIFLNGAVIYANNATKNLNCGLFKDSKGREIYWEKRSVELHFSKNFPVKFRSEVYKAVDAWNAVPSSMKLKVSAVDDDSMTPALDHENVIYWVTDTWKDDKVDEAVTTIHHNRGLITEADVSINAKDYKFYSDVYPDDGDVYLESILIHEFGHVLGLDHSNDESNVMYSALANHVEKKRVDKGAANSLICTYGGTDD